MSNALLDINNCVYGNARDTSTENYVQQRSYWHTTLELAHKLASAEEEVVILELSNSIDRLLRETVEAFRQYPENLSFLETDPYVVQMQTLLQDSARFLKLAEAYESLQVARRVKQAAQKAQKDEQTAQKESFFL